MGIRSRIVLQIGWYVCRHDGLQRKLRDIAFFVHEFLLRLMCRAVWQSVWRALFKPPENILSQPFAVAVYFIAEGAIR